MPDYLAATAPRRAQALRIGVDEGFIATQHPITEVVAAVEAARRVLQGAQAPASGPCPSLALRGAPRLVPHLRRRDGAGARGDLSSSRAGEYHAGMAELIEHGRAVSGETVAQAWVDRLAFERLAAAFQDVDLLLIPTMTTPTPTLPELEAFGADDEVLLQDDPLHRPLRPRRQSDDRAACSFSSARRADLASLVSKPCAEDLLCAAGHLPARYPSWHLRRPLA